ncbi:c-type cytochrome domain-containing protein [Rhodopirellula sp. MGV]|uniref:c-type cytochrome domain-containing protein n=1 Tax=Rhodopirellula sp. MGV TaxID=2023130 RepID=UPI000B9634C1|nr:c-type cytochrome domain-containing protein [Rhodopirellula sp. MGV]OYP28239.1 hypothetical protein CGZ80_27265 [Rhodopirellula sp. MGV]PNY34240.1 hypothetical protein C2E31_24350 [Rhodopirellula baltica]
MLTRLWVCCRQFIAALLFASIAFPSVRQTRADEQLDFAKDIQPILETYCVGCHSAGDAEGEFALDSFESIMHGGESGSVITPGSAASSRMLLMVTGKLDPVMPPDDAEGPSDQELEKLIQWVDQGAAGPTGDAPVKRMLRTPKIQPAEGIAQPITAIAISPDHNHTARGRFQSVLIDSSGQPSITINDKDLGKVNALAFSSDGQRLLVASGMTGAYGRAAIYRTADGQLTQEFVGHRDSLYAAVFSPDESMIATAGYDQVIRLWDVSSAKVLRTLQGHNGAVFDLAFSPDGKTLVSACADETAKLWRVADGERLDTLGQPEGEVLAATITRDNRYVIAGSADNRIRVWQLVSIEQPKINPLVATRFVDETPIVNLALSPDGSTLVVLAESGNVKVLSTDDWQPLPSPQPLPSMGTDLFFAADGQSVSIAMMNGEVVERELPRDSGELNMTTDASNVSLVYLDLPSPTALSEPELRKSQLGPDEQIVSTSNSESDSPAILDVGRSISVDGNIDTSQQADFYRWHCNRNEVWAIDADAIGDGRLDPIVTILDSAGEPVERVRLQAVRDSYFTFRGKDSEQSNDFRVFNWEEMKLGQYFYAAGEVTRLMIHPRGPDSGFNVYPGVGKRWTYFGTSGTTHALGEPAYIVLPLRADQTPLANGLPVFNLPYENDDDPDRVAGKNSRLLFVAPEDGPYTVRITDTRDEGGPEFQYRLTIRAAQPSFRPSNGTIAKPLHAATGREFNVNVDRIDGYDGPVTFELHGLPQALQSNFPLTVESGLRSAVGLIWAPPGTSTWEGNIEPHLTAWAMINGKRVERPVGSIGKLTFSDNVPNVIPSIQPASVDIGPYEDWILDVNRGETVSARVRIERKEGFDNEVSFGGEFSGRNATQGVYVDNIGLNGLLVVSGASEREFFITADETAIPGKRSFFLTANQDGGLTTHSITIEVK